MGFINYFSRVLCHDRDLSLGVLVVGDGWVGVCNQMMS